MASATSRVCTPSGSVNAGPSTCPVGAPNTTGPGNSANRSARTSRAVEHRRAHRISETCPAAHRELFAACRHRGPVARAGRGDTAARRHLRAAGSCRPTAKVRTRCSGARRQLRQGPAQQTARDLPSHQRLCAGKQQLAHRRRDCQRRHQRSAVVALRPTTQAARNGRTVKCDHPAVPHQPRQQRCQVTVADERLRRRANRPRVE